MKKNLPLIFVEVLGIIVLILVVLGIQEVSWVYIAFQTPLCSMVIQICMIGMVVLSIVRSVRKLFGSTVLPSVLYGVILLLLGAGIFFIYPSFFEIARTAPWKNFWFLVSYYSLPAIMVEGGLFTLFEGWVAKSNENFVSLREQKLVCILIVLYLILAVSANFLAITGAISIDHQVAFSRSVIVVALCILLILRVRTRRIS